MQIFHHDYVLRVMLALEVCQVHLDLQGKDCKDHLYVSPKSQTHIQILHVIV